MELPLLKKKDFETADLIAKLTLPIVIGALYLSGLIQGPLSYPLLIVSCGTILLFNPQDNDDKKSLNLVL